MVGLFLAVQQEQGRGLGIGGVRRPNLVELLSAELALRQTGQGFARDRGERGQAVLQIGIVLRLGRVELLARHDPDRFGYPPRVEHFLAPVGLEQVHDPADLGALCRLVIERHRRRLGQHHDFHVQHTRGSDGADVGKGFAQGGGRPFGQGHHGHRRCSPSSFCGKAMRPPPPPQACRTCQGYSRSSSSAPSRCSSARFTSSPYA